MMMWEIDFNDLESDSVKGAVWKIRRFLDQKITDFFYKLSSFFSGIKGALFVPFFGLWFSYLFLESF